MASFNSRTHAGCDLRLSRPCWSHHLFQFTHPRGVRHLFFGCLDTLNKFQFTHPRGVRPSVFLSPEIVACFNSRTHAGCDAVRPGHIHAKCLVSIHAPTRGATLFTHTFARSCACFNSRTHAGCDPLSASPPCAHASFNSRTHAGCDGRSTSIKQ